MSILSDLRSVAADYVAENVTIEIQNVEPDRGTTVNPSEAFTFQIKATNASAADMGGRLINVVWHVWIVSNSGTPSHLHAPAHPW